MVEISLSGSGEGPGWVTAPGYSTAAFSLSLSITGDVSTPYEMPRGPVAGRFQAAGVAGRWATGRRARCFAARGACRASGAVGTGGGFVGLVWCRDW
jgi:hypothetical protein